MKFFQEIKKVIISKNLLIEVKKFLFLKKKKYNKKRK